MDKFKHLAVAIKQARLAKGMSQEDFAEILEVSSTHVKHMESGHRKPSIDMLFLICEKTGLSVDKILYSSESSKSQNDITLDSLVGLCSEEEKELIVKLVEAVLSMRNK